MGAHHPVTIQIAWFAQPCVAVASSLPVESSLLLASVYPLLTLPATTSALIQPVLPIVKAPEAVFPSFLNQIPNQLRVVLVQAVADSSPWLKEEADPEASLCVECSFCAVYYPVEEEERPISEAMSSMRRGSVEQVNTHMDL